MTLPLRSAVLSLAAALLAGAAEGQQSEPTPPVRDPAFADYWYRGVAELSRFELSRSRYGEERGGDAVLVYVTEDFDLGAQVKAEERGPNTVSVLKLNHIARFTTGLYDYSMMRSVFTPVDTAGHPASLKVSASIQDWCGHVWQQLNRRGDRYDATLHSYFEGEADETFEVEGLLEDDVWTRVRFGAEHLPTGEIEMVPGLFWARLRHQRPRPVAARATLRGGAEPGQRRYEIVYPSLQRSLAITFETDFPHGIVAWREELVDAQGRRHVSSAVRTHRMVTDYWNQRDRRHDPLRAELGLRPPR